MDIQNVADLIARQSTAGHPYLEFLRHPSMSLGLYVIPKGGVDGQRPHSEDETYYVVQGKATFHQEGEHRAVSEGDVIYVPAHDEHRFHSVTEDLVLLVFFAPAEHTNKDV